MAAVWSGLVASHPSMASWECDPLVAKAVVHLCVCESFDVFDMPTEMTRESVVELHAFHWGTHPICTNTRCRDLRGCTDECGKVRMATWLPRHRVAVLIYVDDSKRTYVGIKGRILFASECAMLGHRMPKCTMILSHFVVDRTEKGLEPRVLIYDIAMYNGESVTGSDPLERYQMLLGMFKDAKGLVSLQWIGHEASAMKNFEWFTKNVPHEVECIVNLGHDPWTLCRVMHIDTRRAEPVRFIRPNPAH